MNKLKFEKLSTYAIMLILLFGIVYVINTMNVMNDLHETEINTLNNKYATYDSTILSMKSKMDTLKISNNLLIDYAKSKSYISNARRKVLFELKIQQDSVLIDMLNGDINTNKKILELLNTKWDFDKTE